MEGGDCNGSCSIQLGGAPRRSRSRSASRRPRTVSKSKVVRSKSRRSRSASKKSKKVVRKSASRKPRSASRKSSLVKKGGCSSSQRSGCSTTGGARGKRLEKEKKDSLYAKARRYKIKGRSTMKKSELVAAIRSHQAKVGQAIAKRRK